MPGLLGHHQLYSQSLLKLMPIESVMLSNHLILCHTLLPLPSIFPNITVFSNESVLCIRWPKHWSFSFNICPSNEYSGLILLRMDWVSTCCPRDSQESSPTPKFKSINSLALSFLVLQLSHPYMTTGKTISMTRQNFVDKVMFLLFNILSRMPITYLPRSKHSLISWLQLPSAVILESKKNKSVTVSKVSPSICHEVMGLDIMILVF